jgi:GNAT superfamily N-acetyltransferase
MNIETMTERHREEVLRMMRVFYASPAVATDGSEEIFRADFGACVGPGPYLEGYVLTEDTALIGYAMVAKSFSTEYGCPCIWIEELYLKPEHCEKGHGSAFLRFIKEKYPEAIVRLEVEAENRRAVHVYRKNGFEEMPYVEMKV